MAEHIPEQTEPSAGPTVWTQDRDAGTKITASNHITRSGHCECETSVRTDGQTPITSTFPMSGYRHTGCGDGAARTDCTETIPDGTPT